MRECNFKLTICGRCTGDTLPCRYATKIFRRCTSLRRVHASINGAFYNKRPILSFFLAPNLRYLKLWSARKVHLPRLIMSAPSVTHLWVYECTCKGFSTPPSNIKLWPLQHLELTDCKLEKSSFKALARLHRKAAYQHAHTSHTVHVSAGHSCAEVPVSGRHTVYRLQHLLRCE